METAKIEDNLYDQLVQLPENLVGEIINGQLHTHPRPAGPHAIASSSLGMQIGTPYYHGLCGPGGWWIVDEPEIHFVRDVEVLVPDVAGWRRERMPTFPQDQRFEVTPDWVCEVLSPGTSKKDRATKMPVYAHYGVPYLWLIDPLLRTLEAYTLVNGQWLAHGTYSDETEASIPPFADITLVLARLWGET